MGVRGSCVFPVLSAKHVKCYVFHIITFQIFCSGSQGEAEPGEKRGRLNSACLAWGSPSLGRRVLGAPWSTQWAPAEGWLGVGSGGAGLVWVQSFPGGVGTFLMGTPNVQEGKPRHREAGLPAGLPAC